MGGRAGPVNQQTGLSKTVQVTMTPRYEGLSHCKVALAFAVSMDLLGVTALLLGVFAPLEIKGRDFGDFLVYSGALLVLMSLGGWVMWYSGNIEGLTTRKELGYIGTAVDQLARTLSRRMTKRSPRGP
ncbi:transmembrane protein 238-like [Arapaima gigas]